jgi:hypothetical protein
MAVKRSVEVNRWNLHCQGTDHPAALVEWAENKSSSAAGAEVTWSSFPS